MNSVLIVEDNEKLNSINRRALESEGYAVYSAVTLAQARALIETISFDVILLDIMMPDGDGIEFCKSIRGATEAHIIFLTAKREHADRVHGFVSGGDDYLTKPYKIDELLLRIAAALRRRNAADTKAMASVTYGQLTLDLVASKAYWGETDLLLGQKPFALLLLLARKNGKPLSKEELYEAAWKQPMLQNSNALWMQMSRLKKQLKAASNGSAIIDTLRDEGYILNLPQ